MVVRGVRSTLACYLVWCSAASLPLAKPKLNKKREDSLKRALLDLYRDLTLLQNFAIVNYTAVVKVCTVFCALVVGTGGIPG